MALATTKVRKAYLDLRIGESGVYFLVQPIDDFTGCIFGRADALPSIGLETSQNSETVGTSGDLASALP